MPSNIQQLLADQETIIDYKQILSQHPWLLKKDMKCVISPDSDGMLSALLMHHFLNWDVVGFYDGKVMSINSEYSMYDDNIVFLDIEIYRKGVKSVGQHMLTYHNGYLPKDWKENFADCVQPNLIRGYDKNKYFRLKFPFATVHFLMALISQKISIDVSKKAICPLLFTDGTFNVLFKYPENVLNWLGYLDASNNALAEVFLNDHYSVIELVEAMNKFFIARDSISDIRNERGDRLRISDSSSVVVNHLQLENGLYSIDSNARIRLEEFLNMLGSLTGWTYDSSAWSYHNHNVVTFPKTSFDSRKWNLNITNWEKMLSEKPLSWAITSGANIEFSTE